MKTTQQIVAECEHQRRVDIHAHNTQPVLTGRYLLAAQSVAKPRPTRSARLLSYCKHLLGLQP